MSLRRSRRHVRDSPDDENETSEHDIRVKRPRPESVRPVAAYDMGKDSVNGSQAGSAASDAEIEDDDGEEFLEDDADALQKALINMNAQKPVRESPDAHLPGAVVRVKLLNFMTYDFIEFHPGSRLNMILGPNGTGKSSIAASIAIGLGFPPKIMGRAHDLKAYVKQGAEISEVEIELKGHPGEPNPVIWRRFNRADDKSEWALNGRSSTKREVQDIVHRFGVQANNLCSFLPQDRVADFAKMNPITVLKQTILAAGDSRLTGWHEDLIKKGEEAKIMDQKLADNIRKRDTLQHQVAELEPEVRHYQLRNRLEKDLQVQQCLLVGAQVQEIQNEVKSNKRKIGRLNEKLVEYHRTQEPLVELKESLERKKNKAETRQKTISKQMMDSSQALRQSKRNMQDAENAGKDAQEELKSIRSKVKQREARIAKLQSNIAAQRAILDSPQANVHERVQEKKEEQVASIRSLQAQQTRLEAEFSGLQSQASAIRNDINVRETRQRELNNIDYQRREGAFKLDPSIRYVANWIEEHKAEFQEQVHLPPMISVNVPDKNYAWQVEACTSLAQRKTFICQNQADYRRLMDLIGQPFVTPEGAQRKVSVPLAVVEVSEATVNPPRPCTSVQLQNLGFDGFAIDYVEADPAVRAFLCQARLHTAALTQKPGHLIDADRVAQLGIPIWHTSTDSTRATRSMYGRRDFQFSTMPPAPARAFNLSVNTEAVKALTDEIAALKRNVTDLEIPLVQAKREADEGTRKVQEKRDGLAEINNKILEFQAEVQKYTKAHLAIEQFTERLKTEEDAPSPESGRARIQRTIVTHATKRVEALQEYRKITNKSKELMEKYIFVTFELAQLESNIKGVLEVCKIGEEKEAELTELAQELLAKKVDLKDRTKIAQTQFTTLAKAISQDARPQLQAEIKKTLSVPDINHKIMDLRAQLELADGVSHGVVERHRRLSDELDVVVERVEGQQQVLHRLRTKIQRLLEKFNPALDTLIKIVSERFSNSFQEIGCTGEVRVNRVEGNYDAWGVEILVSYRDGEPLEVLTASRQSGGEKSLATVTYLMSMSEMSRTPFSLVDEINQGMDARAERNMHNQLVRTTSADAAGQYFLITPKLLTDLHYDPSMKILIVSNGTYIPDPTQPGQHFGRLGSLLSKYKRAHNITA